MNYIFEIRVFMKLILINVQMMNFFAVFLNMPEELDCTGFMGMVKLLNLQI